MTVGDIRQTWIGRSMTAHTLCDPAYEIENQNCIYLFRICLVPRPIQKKKKKKNKPENEANSERNAHKNVDPAHETGYKIVHTEIKPCG